MTKQEQTYITKYLNSTNHSVENCYKKPSVNKTRAEAWCRDKMQRQRGYCFRILSYNTMFFTCGWLTSDDVLHIETPSKSIEIKEASKGFPF